MNIIDQIIAAAEKYRIARRDFGHTLIEDLNRQGILVDELHLGAENTVSYAVANGQTHELVVKYDPFNIDNKVSIVIKGKTTLLIPDVIVVKINQTGCRVRLMRMMNSAYYKLRDLHQEAASAA